jgi:hypothetical protein
MHILDKGDLDYVLNKREAQMQIWGGGGGGLNRNNLKGKKYTMKPYPIVTFTTNTNIVFRDFH